MCILGDVCREKAAQALGELAARLTPEERRARYFATIRCPVAWERNVMHNYRLVLGAYTREKALVAVLVVTDAGCNAYEFAWMTDQAWRSKKLARTLGEIGLDAVRRATGATQVIIEVLSSNVPMLKLAHALGAHVTEREGGITTYVLEIPPLSWRELGQGIVATQRDMVVTLCFGGLFGPATITARWLDNKIRAA